MRFLVCYLLLGIFVFFYCLVCNLIVIREENKSKDSFLITLLAAFHPKLIFGTLLLLAMYMAIWPLIVYGLIRKPHESN